jgi:hypothetical protein
VRQVYAKSGLDSARPPFLPGGTAKIAFHCEEEEEDGMAQVQRAWGSVNATIEGDITAIKATLKTETTSMMISV